MAPETPLSVYRLQFGPAFGLADALELVPYLDDLGVTHLFASPLLRARSGSPHGYDVVDPTALNPDVGTEADLDALVDALRERGMGLLLDIVPNHMAASHENPWWWDVLARGPDSPYAGHFDIDWDPPSVKGDLQGRVLLPVLGRPYGEVLEAGELRLALEDRGLVIAYHDRRFPLALASWPRVLDPAVEGLRDQGAEREAAALDEVREAVRAAGVGDAARRAGARDRLVALAREDDGVREALEAAVEALNGTPGEPRSFDGLDRLLEEQAYRLASWRRAADEINYRRFFNISDLVGVRVEDPGVLEATHELLWRWAAEGTVQGFRVDHVDGLWDPKGYLDALRARARSPGSAPFVVVEKILAEGEGLPEDWDVEGTTGYEVLQALNALFVEPSGLDALDGVYRRFVGQEVTFDNVYYTRQKQAIRRLFTGEMRALAHTLAQLAARHRHARDLTLEEIREALAEATTGLPVYRTYVRGPEVSDRDRGYLEEALRTARRAGEAVPEAALRFLRSVLLLDPPPYLEGERGPWLGFLMRWQQLTGPVMAKGMEDTAFYVYNRLLSLNEVGGDPRGRRVPTSREAFHRLQEERQARWPRALTVTSTHDTKRSEDVRARLNVLSEMPTEWEAALARWRRWNERKKERVDGRPAPDANEEVLLYQTLLGAWPLEGGPTPGFRKRIRAYLVKALREAKVHTTWADPDEAYEAAVLGFLDALLDPEASERFLEDFRAFQGTVAAYGALNGVAQVVLKVASPGVPSIYQGTELWDFSLVDPDNRRPVDFEIRTQALRTLRKRAGEGRGALAADLRTRWREGALKLYVTHQALRARREDGPLFRDGAYVPVEVAGPRRDHVVAFARRAGTSWALAVAARWLLRLGPPEAWREAATWEETALVLPEGAPLRWRDVLTDAIVDAGSAAERAHLPVAPLFEALPAALLLPSGED